MGGEGSNKLGGWVENLGNLFETKFREGVKHV